MAKRPRVSQTQDSPPTKKPRTSNDSSSTPRSLRQLQRPNLRSNACQAPQQIRGCLASDLRRYARNGGPDLTSLRGFPHPIIRKMAGSGAPGSKRQSSFTTLDNLLSINPPSVSRSRSTYTADTSFEAILFAYNIFGEGHGHLRVQRQPTNLAQIQHRLAASRASLSPSQRDASEYQLFLAGLKGARNKMDVMVRVVSLLTGHDASFASRMRVRFNNLTSLTDGATVHPKPDIYYGAYCNDVHAHVLEELNPLIVPIDDDGSSPVAPNCFLQAKAVDRLVDVAKRQITHDVAAGTRAMNALQNYREVSTAPYDGNAYTLGAAYMDGALTIYAGHMHPGETGPETHVTQVEGLYMPDDADTYFKGVEVFRNARDLAREFRNDLIASANANAQGAACQPRVSRNTAEGHGEDDDEDEPTTTSTRPSVVSSPVARAPSPRTRPKARSKRGRASSPPSRRKTRSHAGKRL